MNRTTLIKEEIKKYKKELNNCIEFHNALTPYKMARLTPDSLKDEFEEFKTKVEAAIAFAATQVYHYNSYLEEIKQAERGQHDSEI